MNYNVLLLSLLMFFVGCKTPRTTLIHKSGQLKIEQISENTFVHISYLQTESFGKVGCNGMIVIDNGEAIVFDTPTDDSASEELINWVEQKLRCNIKGVVITHFHEDCLGGLRAFHSRNIPSYAEYLTIELAKSENEIIPQIGFEKSTELPLGNEKVIVEYFGEGHTKDNVVGYFPSEKALFGGCLIKCMGAGKGYLGDANIKTWSSTVEKVKAKHKGIEIVVPGHGKSGGTELLDYTVEMFRGEE